MLLPAGTYRGRWIAAWWGRDLCRDLDFGCGLLLFPDYAARSRHEMTPGLAKVEASWNWVPAVHRIPRAAFTRHGIYDCVPEDWTGRYWMVVGWSWLATFSFDWRGKRRIALSGKGWPA
jgi:hypothetical protein